MIHKILNFGKLNIINFFERIFTCTEIGAGKAQPDIYLAAARYMGTLPKDTWVFEDALYAIKSAKAAGLLVVAVYDESFHEEREEIRVISDFYLDSLEDWEMIL